MAEWIAKNVHLIHDLGDLNQNVDLLSEADLFIATIDALRLEDNFVQGYELGYDHAYLHLFAHMDRLRHYYVLGHLVKGQACQILIESFNLVIANAVVIDHATQHIFI